MRVHWHALVLMLLTTATAFAEVKAETLIGILNKIQLADATQASAFIQAVPDLPEPYLTKKLERIRQLDVGASVKFRGLLEGTKLIALAIEEKPGDIDPVLFVRDGETFRLLLNLTRLRDSGLEKDVQCLHDMDKITAWIANLEAH